MAEVNKCTYCKLLSSLQKIFSEIPVAVSLLAPMLLETPLGNVQR